MYNAIVVKIDEYITTTDPPLKYVNEYNALIKEFSDHMNPLMKQEYDKSKAQSPTDIMNKVDDIKKRNMIVHSPQPVSSSKPKSLQDIDKLYESTKHIDPPETKSCCILL